MLDNKPPLVFQVFSLQQIKENRASWQFDLFLKSCSATFAYTSVILAYKQTLLIIGDEVLDSLRKLTQNMREKLQAIADEYLPSNFIFKSMSGYRIKQDYPHFTESFAEYAEKQLTMADEIYEYYKFKKLQIVGNHHSVLIKALSASPMVSLHISLSRRGKYLTVAILVQFRGSVQQLNQEREKFFKLLHEYPNITGELSPISRKFVIKNPGRCLFGLVDSTISTQELYDLFHNGPARYEVLQPHRSLRKVHHSVLLPPPVSKEPQDEASSVSHISNESAYSHLKHLFELYGWHEFRYFSQFQLATFQFGELTAKVYLSKSAAVNNYPHTRDFLPKSMLIFIGDKHEDVNIAGAHFNSLALDKLLSNNL